MKSFKQHLNERTLMRTSARNWKEYHEIMDSEFVKPKIKLKKLPTKNVTKADLIYGIMIQAQLDSYMYSDLTLMPGATRVSNAWSKKTDKMRVAYAQENDMSTDMNGLAVSRMETQLTSKAIGGEEYMLDKKEWKNSKQKKDYDVWEAEQMKIYPEQF